MDEEDKRNKEFLIVGQAFLHTGISKIEDLIQNYINASEQYHDSYSVALLNKIKTDIEKMKDVEKQVTKESINSKESLIYFYSGKIIKIFDKTTQYGFCIKKDYINDKLYQLSIKKFNNRDYGKILYEDIRNSFLVIKKDNVLER